MLSTASTELDEVLAFLGSCSLCGGSTDLSLVDFDKKDHAMVKKLLSSTGYVRWDSCTVCERQYHSTCIAVKLNPSKVVAIFSGIDRRPWHDCPHNPNSD